MSRFLTELEVKLVDDNANEGRGEWELTADLIYESDIAKATFVVQKGFRTDFESVPRIPIVFDALGDRFSRPATIHDALYSGEFPSISREMSDKILRESILITGGSEIEANAVYEGVRLFGNNHWWQNKT